MHARDERGMRFIPRGARCDQFYNIIFERYRLYRERRSRYICMADEKRTVEFVWLLPVFTKRCSYWSSKKKGLEGKADVALVYLWWTSCTASVDCAKKDSRWIELNSSSVSKLKRHYNEYYIIVLKGFLCWRRVYPIGRSLLRAGLARYPLRCGSTPVSNF